MKDLSTRLITAVIGIALILGIIIKGGWLLALAICIISMIGVFEFERAISNGDIYPIKSLGYLACILFGIMNILYSKGIFFDSLKYITGIMCILTIITIFAMMTFLKRDDLEIVDIAITLLSVLYIPMMLNYVFLLDGNIFIWLIFIIAFGTDTFAYFAGNFFGKNKLSPSISPNKTIEGSIGGIIGSVLLTVIYSKYIIGDLVSIWKLILLAIIASIISQSGDLFASKMKRSVDIKDYGKLFPGHGGVLDRFDSIIVTAPIVYFFVIFVVN